MGLMATATFTGSILDRTAGGTPDAFDPRNEPLLTKPNATGYSNGKQLV
jgi:hypothetical protein